MNLPNRLTLLRILLIPVFVVIFYLPIDQNYEFLNLTLSLVNLIALIIFCIAAFTDFLDGYYARKYNLVTTFGKFMDPLADKLLVLSALLMLIELDILPAFVAILILSRELMVTGIRTLAISEGKVIAASPLGKAKTVSQMLMIIFLLFVNSRGHVIFSELSIMLIIADVLIILATALTVISGYDYLMKNRKIIFSSK